MLILSIISILLLWNNSLAEWIDMPQFSDENRIYRIPSSKQDHYYQFSPTITEGQSSRKDLYEEVAAVNGNEGSLLSHRFEDSDSETTTIHEYTNEENSFSTSSEKQEKTTDSSIADKNNSNTEYYNGSLISNNVDILKYLPVNVLKTVHQILKSQSTSSEGKLLFLKIFEQTLITEIESRLAQTVTGSRHKRGTEHYDLGYDSHDNATGFPSIEGALMAISFLTFAVYLVRLVMLLFRNMNNPAPTPTGATLLLGRRKRRRSINILDEETVKILSSMDKFI
ncbi:uncharacterized protein LOC117227595 [Megalopta genalis]|uniref:uncharacterized protein LOC117227595 n=1 Tax=Megalopta genalis TaxID=115081 RepID=UPI00144304D2|nr:uncharacterized protein LOC117227595 [Megalopta genalis]